MGLTHSFFISSSHAVKVDPATRQETLYPVDELGIISAGAGDVLRFKNITGSGYVPINE